MKLQISFDTIDLDSAIKTAAEVAQYADIIEIGTVLIYQHGIKAVHTFREQFPKHTLLVDAKIINHVKSSVPLFSRAGANWITIMSGTNNNIIHTACSTAHNLNLNVMLDLLDSKSMVQTALEAEKLGANALLFNHPYDVQNTGPFLEKWEMVKGNTHLPIFIAAHINRENIAEIVQLKPAGIIVGSSITGAENPAAEAQFFRETIDSAGK